MKNTGKICVFFLLCSKLSTVQAEKPNILLITADDLGFQLGCYGDKYIETPNIDKLATWGIRFDNAYVTQASSSPSRSSILTGLYPHQNGQVGLANRGFRMKDGLLLLPNLLKECGYRTGIIGKLHVNDESNFLFDYENKQTEPTREVVRVADEAESFMTKKDTKPFFLYLNYFDPHTPLKEQVEGIPAIPYTTADISFFPFQCINHSAQLTRIANYYSCIKRLDYGIGKLLDKLEDNDLLKNTIIIFISDNGINFTRGKTTCYEVGVRVPMIISWKNHIESHSISKSLISTVDIFPTLCDLADIKIPDKLSGKSFKETLYAPDKKHREYIFSEFTFHANGNKSYFPRRAVFDGRYKFIYNVLGDKISNPIYSIDGDKAYKYAMDGDDKAKTVFKHYINPGKYELYDIVKDPYEFNNLVANDSYKEVIKRLKRTLEAWIISSEDPYNEEFALSVYQKNETD